MYVECGKPLPHIERELNWCLMTQTFGGVVLNGLFKGCDVAEGAEKQDHLLLLISYGCNLYEEPDGRS